MRKIDSKHHIEGAAEQAREDRYRAILTLAAPGRKRLDTDDLTALSEHLEDGGAGDLAAAVLNHCTVTERGE